MKYVVKMVLTVGLAFGTLPAFANDQAKIALARKAIIAGQISPYATSNLKKLLRKAHQINDKMAKTAEYEGIGCEFAEHFYLGHGNGGLEAQDIRNWKAKVLSNGGVRITFSQQNYDANLIEMDMVANGKNYLIDDVRFGYSDNPKKVPTGTDYSIRLEAQGMVNKNGCTF